jgi:hypothetical protein
MYIGIGEGIAIAAPFLHELNKGKGKNRDEMPILNTELPVDQWWDSLDYQGKVSVGMVALHFYMMTPNSKFICNETKFKDLPKRQQKRIENCLKEKDYPYSMYDIKGLFKLR